MPLLLAWVHLRPVCGDNAANGDVLQANSMGKGAFITTFSSESVEAAAKGNPEQFTVAKSEGVLASEEMLRLIVAACS